MSVGDRCLAVVATSHEVAVDDTDFRDEPVRRRVAAGNRELAGRLLFDIDIDDHAVRRRTGLIGDPYRLEKAEVLQPSFCTIDQRPVIGIALAEIEFAADHVIARSRIAADIDALDIGSRTFLDDESNIDRPGFEISLPAWPHSGKGIACLAA